MVAGEDVNAVQTDATDTFRTGVTILQSADGVARRAVDLHYPREDGTGVGICEGGRRHVEVSA